MRKALLIAFLVAAPAAVLAQPQSQPGPYRAPQAYYPPPPPPPYHFTPSDFPKQERRIAGLIANAETRDSSGSTERTAGEGRYERERCRSKACVIRAYAAEEAKLRQWEGSGDVK